MLIKAQESRLKALKADFYPQFSITGQAGLQSIGFNNLLKPGSFLGLNCQIKCTTLINKL